MRKTSKECGHEQSRETNWTYHNFSGRCLMNTAYPYAEGKRPISQRSARWVTIRRIAIITSLLFLVLGAMSSSWAQGGEQSSKVNPYLHRADVSIHFGGGGFYFGVPFGPVYVQPHFHVQPYSKFYRRHGQHKRHFKPSRKYYRFKERGDRHGRHFKKGRHGGRHHQKFRH